MQKHQDTPPNVPVIKAGDGEDPIPKGFYGLDVIWPITNQRFRALFPITWSTVPHQDDVAAPVAA
jgi:hypothetical protein